MRTVQLVSLSLALAACGAPPVDSTQEERAQEESAPADVTAPDVSVDDDRYEGAPAGTRGLVSLLMARHVEDLPTADVLHAHEDAEASLRWLALEGDRLVLRVRALMSSRHFSSAETRALLLGVLRDESAHASLRGGAARGSGGLVLDEELRAALEAARASGDPRVARAVDARLAQVAGEVDGTLTP